MIKVIISPEGNIEIEGIGMRGQKCLSSNLSSLGEIVTQKIKEEYYEEEQHQKDRIYNQF